MSSVPIQPPALTVEQIVAAIEQLDILQRTKIAKALFEREDMLATDDADLHPHALAVVSESAWGKDWDTPEEDAAWADL